MDRALRTRNREQRFEKQRRAGELKRRVMDRQGNVTGVVNRFTIIKIIFICMTLGAFLYFIVGECVLPGNSPRMESRCREWDADWMLVHEDGTRESVILTHVSPAARNELVTLEAVLPEDLSQDSMLCFKSARQEMEIFVDGELRQTYSSKGGWMSQRASSVAYVFVELTPEDEGKTLTVSTRTDSRYTGEFYPVYIGDPVGICLYMFDLYGPELLMALFMLLFGISSIFGGYFLNYLWHKKNDLPYLGWGVSLATVWVITNSLSRQFIFPNISIINDIPFLMLMLATLPFLLYMNGIQELRYQKIYFPLCVLNVVNCVVCCVLHFTNTVDFGDTIKVIAGLWVLSIAVMAGTVMLDIKRKYISRYKWVAVGLLGAFLIVCMSLAVYFFSPASFSGIFLAAGLVFILLMSVLSTVKSIIIMEQDKLQAQRESEAKAQVLANMSHEIRTPINAVIGMNEMVLRESSEESIRGYAMDIRNAGQTLLSMINEVLDFSKIESGKMELVPVEYDLGSLFHDLSNMISLKARNKGLRLNLHVSADLPGRLFGDEIRIRQILINLLNNAVKYTEKGSVTLRVSGERDGGDEILHFMVEDTGIGIKEEDIPKLFMAFERIEEQRNRNVEGTGLGINIAMQLLSMMDSKLNVRSVYGEGSVFSFDLRQRIVSGEPIGDLEEKIKKRGAEYSRSMMFTAPKARIIVVDDNEVNRRVFAGLLKNTKIVIEEAVSGEECLKKVFEKHYDIIFLDHMMPGMDGIETMRHIREKKEHPCKTTPVIALTANAVAGAKEMYLSEGFNGFLPKPVVLEKLEKMIIELLPEEMIERELSFADTKTPKADGEAQKAPVSMQKEEDKQQIKDISVIITRLERIRDAAEKGDAVSEERILRQLLNYKFDELAEKKIHQLKTAVEDRDNGQALAVIKSLMAHYS